MAKKGFKPSQNFILNAVGTNYTKAVAVSNHHMGTLEAAGTDPDIAARGALYIPVHTDLLNATSAKAGKVETRISKTKTVKALFKDMIATELPAWQTGIMNVYPKRSPEYKAFFGAGNKAFEKGAIDMRISAVKTLSEQCAADANAGINAIGINVGKFYHSLMAARTVQLGGKEEVSTGRSTQKDAIYAMCVLQFVDFGFLITKFPENPDKINGFFDLQTIMSHPHSKLYAGEVNAARNKKALTHKFNDNSTIIFSNTGETDLLLYVTKSAKDKIHAQALLVKAGETKVIAVKSIGNTNHRILMVQNADATSKGSYEVTVGQDTAGSGVIKPTA